MSLAQRFALIDRWCRTRGITDLYTFFVASEPSLAHHYLRIRSVNRGSTAVVDTDANWLDIMTAIINKLP